MDDDEVRPAVEMGAVDTHCHLFLLEGDPAPAIEAARLSGVGRLVCVGIDAESSLRSAELAESFRGVFATAGVHPHTASSFDAAAGNAIEELLSNPQVVAVGETGIDRYRMLSPVEDQERALRVHAALSRETGKPLVVHCRDAWPDVIRVLDDERADRVVLHCFSGDARTALACAERGWFLSFAGNVTYPANGHLREAAAAAPAERILVETDSPFLAPQGLRGRDNEPANVLFVVDAVAAARGESRDAVLGTTARNAMAAFPGLR
ncbi:MAG: TatD family hydrolase [Actinobacteria bacterium]|nr:TatD family hydrolase [Actinomycetota bacterium]